MKKTLTQNVNGQARDEFKSSLSTYRCPKSTELPTVSMVRNRRQRMFTSRGLPAQDERVARFYQVLSATSLAVGRSLQAWLLEEAIGSIRGAKFKPPYSIRIQNDSSGRYQEAVVALTKAVFRHNLAGWIVSTQVIQSAGEQAPRRRPFLFRPSIISDGI